MKHLIDKGFEYLGTDGKVCYLRNKQGIYRSQRGELEWIGLDLPDVFLERLRR